MPEQPLGRSVPTSPTCRPSVPTASCSLHRVLLVSPQHWFLPLTILSPFCHISFSCNALKHNQESCNTPEPLTVVDKQLLPTLRDFAGLRWRPETWTGGRTQLNFKNSSKYLHNLMAFSVPMTKLALRPQTPRMEPRPPSQAVSTSRPPNNPASLDDRRGSSAALSPVATSLTTVYGGHARWASARTLLWGTALATESRLRM